MPRLPDLTNVPQANARALRAPALRAANTQSSGAALQDVGSAVFEVGSQLRAEQEQVKRAQDNAFLASLNADLSAERTKILLDPPTDQSDATGPDDTVFNKSLRRFDEVANARLETIQDEELKSRAQVITLNSRTPFETTLLKDDIQRRRNDAIATTDNGLSTLATDAFRNPAITEQHLETGLGMIRQLAADFNLPASARQKSEAVFARSLFESHIRGFIERGDTKRAREILDSQALDDELGVDSIRKLDREIETALGGERREVQADLRDHLASLQTTGVGVAGFKERALSVLDAGTVSEIEKQESLALQVFGTVSSFPAQTVSGIAESLEGLRPAPGEEGFADKQRVFNAAAVQARAVLKQRAADPATAALKVPGVKQESDEAGIQERIAAQRALAIPPSLTRPLTNAEADAIVANIGSSEDRASVILSLRETYGEFYPQVISQLSEKGLDPRLGVLASVVDDPALSQTMAQVIDTGRTELKKGLAPTDVSEIREQTNDALLDFRQAVELGDFTGARTESVNQIVSAVEDLALFYFRQSGSVSESVERATSQVIHDRFTITDTFYIPNTSNGKPVDAEAVQAFAEQRQDEEFIRDFNPPGLGTSGGLDEGARQEALIKTAVESGFWVTNETGTGLFLMVPFAGGSALPLINDKGERYEFSFTDPLEIEREGLFESFPGAGAPN